LYQHSILQEGFYSVAEVYDFLVYNYFSDLNSRYNHDFSAWKAIKTSLEKVEVLFDNHLPEYEKLVKTIGLLSINAQAGSYIDRDFLTKYAEKSLGIKNADQLIED